MKFNNLSPLNLNLKIKFKRTLWLFVWAILYRPSPVLLHPWRCSILRVFGAKIARGVHPYPSCKIWAPWNLVMLENSCLGPNVDCYNVAPVVIGRSAIVSQYCFLCTATHDYSKSSFPLLVAPIVIGDFSWITADVFIGPGVSVGEGAVVNVRSSVFSDLPPWVIAKGNPAKEFKKRVVK